MQTHREGTRWAQFQRETDEVNVTEEEAVCLMSVFDGG